MTMVSLGEQTWKCAACEERVAVSTPLSWRCPNAHGDDRHHVLLLDQPIAPLRGTGEENPFLSFRKYLAWDTFAQSLGLSDGERVAIIEESDAAIAKVGGVGFRVTPFARNNALSEALGFTAQGGIWVKDETNGVGGSHKARHIYTELLHLLALEHSGKEPWAKRPPLAIASCGNAAFAASMLARAVDWPIMVFVPEMVAPELTELLASVDASIVRCSRLDSDPAGDPTVHRFREAVRDGAIPFGVQGTENAWCLDGGRTIGWEIADVQERQSGPPLDRLFVQVGGGAFAACAASGVYAGGLRPRLHAVQTQGCAPLQRAWSNALSTGGARNAGSRWAQCMWPWEDVQTSLADGILDDETYDWIGVCNAMADSGGSPVLGTEQHIVDAYALAHNVTEINVSPTGAAGLAGVLAIREDIANDERVVVVFSGVRRQFMPLPK
jgi:threonine dehydratase